MPRIAIIEDDPSVRRALVLVLESAGFEALDFPSGDAFMESRAIEACDCIITDLCMPGLSGFDFMERMQAEGRTPPVIVVTAFGNSANRERARRFGVKAFFGKPIDDQALVDAINWELEGNT